MEKKNKDTPKDLIGFKDFIEYEKKGTGNRPTQSSHGSFELLSFLEHESIRLGKTIELCETQTYTLKNNPQQGMIQEKQNQLINKNKLILIEILSRTDSPLTKNLRETLGLHFKS